MNNETEHVGSQANWFVGAMYGGGDDQTTRFLAEKIWENGYDDKLGNIVRSMRQGDRIAIKSSYTRKHGLPFDNRGQAVSVMAIKARRHNSGGVLSHLPRYWRMALASSTGAIQSH